MKRNGFTLVELLAVITIIALLFSIAALKMGNSSTKRKEEDYKNIVKLIEKNTGMLVSSDDEIYTKVTDKLIKKEDKCRISYRILVNNKLADEEEKNPVTGKNINLNSYIIVSVDDNYNLKYKFVNIDEEKNAEQPVSCLSLIHI